MKMQVIKFVVLSVFLLIQTTCFSMNPADGDNLYVFTKQSDAPAIYSLDDLDKITFSEKGIKFWNTKWPTEYTYGNFRLITFKEMNNPNGVEQVVIGGNGVHITYDRGQEKVLVKSEKTLLGVIIYDLQGRPVFADSHMEEAYELPLSSLPRGIYVVKVNGSSESQKIVK